jgi:hypothetical protein
VRDGISSQSSRWSSIVVFESECWRGQLAVAEIDQGVSSSG